MKRLFLPDAASAMTQKIDGMELVWAGKYDTHGQRVVPEHTQPQLQVFQQASASNWLIHGDCLEVAQSLLSTHRGKLDLVYLDPPFNTGSTFACERQVGADEVATLRLPGFGDRWREGANGFLAMLEPRLRAIYELLSPTGSLYLHLDPTIGHAARLVLDEIFGAQSFQREIIWRIGWVSGFKTRVRNWIRNHDCIFFYSKDPKKFTFNKQYVPHRSGYRRRGQPGKQAGLPLDDVWNANDAEFALQGAESLDSIQIKSLSREKSGWATQKNESLIARIIAASSNPGDCVADFFAGSGTSAVVAARLGRHFVAADVSPVALQLTRARLDATMVKCNEAWVAPTVVSHEQKARREHAIALALGLTAKDLVLATTTDDSLLVDQQVAKAALHSHDVVCLLPRGHEVAASWLAARLAALLRSATSGRLVVVADAFAPLAPFLAGHPALVRIVVSGGGWEGEDLGLGLIRLPIVDLDLEREGEQIKKVTLLGARWPLANQPVLPAACAGLGGIEGWRLLHPTTLQVIAASWRQRPHRQLAQTCDQLDQSAYRLRVEDVYGGSQDLWLSAAEAALVSEATG